jgi:hypothetical protein
MYRRSHWSLGSWNRTRHSNYRLQKQVDTRDFTMHALSRCLTTRYRFIVLLGSTSNLFFVRRSFHSTGVPPFIIRWSSLHCITSYSPFCNQLYHGLPNTKLVYPNVPDCYQIILEDHFMSDVSVTGSSVAAIAAGRPKKCLSLSSLFSR